MVIAPRTSLFRYAAALAAAPPGLQQLERNGIAQLLRLLGIPWPYGSHRELAAELVCPKFPRLDVALQVELTLVARDICDGSGSPWSTSSAVCVRSCRMCNGQTGRGGARGGMQPRWTCDAFRVDLPSGGMARVVAAAVMHEGIAATQARVQAAVEACLVVLSVQAATE